MESEDKIKLIIIIAFFMAYLAIMSYLILSNTPKIEPDKFSIATGLQSVIR